MIKTDSVAVLRELRIGVEMDAHLDPLGPAKLAALDEALAALSAQGEWPNLPPIPAHAQPQTVVGSTLIVVPGGVGDAVTEEMVDAAAPIIYRDWHMADRDKGGPLEYNTRSVIRRAIEAALAARTGKGEANGR